MRKATDFLLLRRKGGGLFSHALPGRRDPSSHIHCRTQSEQPWLRAAAAWQWQQQQRQL